MVAPEWTGGACPECGVENARDHNYCKHCGTPLREIDLDRELGTGFAERTRDRCLQLLKADPDNGSTHYNRLGQIGNAIRAFQKTVELDDSYPGVISSLPSANTAAAPWPSASRPRGARSS